MTSRTATSSWPGFGSWSEPPALAALLAVAAWGWPASGLPAWSVKTSVLALALAAFAAWSVSRGARGERGTPALVPLLAFGAWMLASAGWSNDRVRGIEPGLVVSWAVLALFSVRGTGRSAWPVLAVLAMAAVEALAGAWQANLGPGGRLSGTFINAAHHGALLACGWAATVPFTAGASVRTAWAAGIGGFILLSAGAMSGSRALIPAVACTLLVAWLDRPRGAAARRLALVSGVALLALLAPGGVRERIAVQMAGGEPLPLGRADLWAASLRMVRSAPLLGVGAGGFGDAFPAHRSPLLAHLVTDYAHNEPLQAACEGGVIGLGLLCWALVVWGRSRPFGRGGRNRSPWDLARRLALVPLAVSALADFPFHVPTLALSALALAAPQGGAPGPVRAKPRRRSIPFPVTAFLLVLFGTFALRMAVIRMADREYLRGVELAGDGDVAGARAEFGSALALAGDHAEALHALAELDLDGNAARKRLARAMELRPAWLPPVVTLFEREMDAGAGRSASLLLKRAESLDPNGLDTILMRVRWEAASGRGAEARRMLGEADLRWPNQLDVWLEKARLLEEAGDVAGCRSVLRRILAVFPGNIHAGKWLNRLGK